MEKKFLKKPDKDEQTKHKVSRKKEITKVRAEINEIETKETMENINETKSWFFEKINKTDKPWARLIEKKERVPKSMKSVMKKTEIQRIMRDCYEQLYTNKMNNIKEKHESSRWSQEEIENMNRPIITAKLNK